MIRTFRSRALKRFWERDDAKGLRPDWIAPLRRRLDQLDQSESPQDMEQPGFGFHALRGNLTGRYAITVSRNWRLTFGWDDGDAIDIDLEDYHGR